MSKYVHMQSINVRLIQFSSSYDREGMDLWLIKMPVRYIQKQANMVKAWNLFFSTSISTQQRAFIS